MVGRMKIISAWLVLFLSSMVSAFAQSSANSSIHLEKGWCTIDYSPVLGIPCRVAWSLCAGDIGRTKRDPSFRFKADGALPRPRVTSALYNRSGYDRGHMVPAADRSATRGAMRQTFTMSNVCPQTPSLNRGAWKYTEELERSVALSGVRCSIIAAPLFLSPDTQWIGRHRVAVPTHFVKFIFTSKPAHMYGLFILPNL